MSLNLSLDFFHFKVGAVKQGGYEFGNFRIDPETKMLYRGGTEITLPPKVIETLIVLVENQGEIVSKTELMDIVWPDTVVEESNLSQHLYYLRKTLGNAPDGTPIIETLRRRGYRFNAVATRIGSASLSSRPGSSPRPTVQNLSIRRHGNVLTVADWEAEPAPLASPVRPVVDGTVDRRNKRPILAYGVIGALTVGLVAVSLWLLQGRSAVRTETVEDIQTAFLTNGRPVEGVAISPDGNYFAYHELEAPIGRLWVQQTGQSGRVEIVPGAERWMGAKTFSPDGQFIYYVAREASDPLAALYRVPTLGGPHTKVLQNVLMPVTFSPDGKELAFVRYAADNSSAWLVVASSDGRNERIILKREGKDTLGTGSAWSPDGRFIVFASILIDDEPGGDIQISALELSSGKISTLSSERWDTCYRIQWTDEGRGLVFIGTREGESNSARRDQVYYLSYPGGQARKLTNEGNRHEVMSLSVTSNNEILVLPMGRLSQIWAMELDDDLRTGTQLTRGLFDGRAGIAPLPDGRIGYIARTGESANLWIMNADGSGQKQLTGDPTLVEEVRASADGTFFTFAGVKDRRSHLFRIGSDGSGQVQVTTGRGDEIDSSITPDGAWIIYGSHLSEGAASRSLIWKVPSTGGTPEQVSSIVCSTPHVSPDGKLISCATERTEIAILRLADGALLQTLRPRPQVRLNIGARWTADSGAVTYVALEGGAANLWLHPLNGGEPRRLTNFSGGIIYNYAFSPDGKRMFLARGYPIHDAMLIRNIN